MALLALAGCASVPPPTLQLDAAEVALAGAREVRAERFAPDELRLARLRLEEAQAAMARRKYDEARQLAEQAEAEASLAIARSRAAAWRAEVEQKTEQNASLRRSLLGEGHRP
ncbi:MAG: DUF4398 domain-containing protein [Rehaibacterium terrae]|uniref:DUF4398 domain-containing protein n=1 Tax=Rehaibacterium terrae TaxID=1341696 RepID=UPI003919F9BD